MDCENNPDENHKTNDEEENLLGRNRPPLFHCSISFEQLMFIVVVILPAFAPGMSVGFSAIALPALNLSPTESAWFASMPTVGSVLGTLITGLVLDRCGRKMGFFLITVSSFIGFILLATSSKIIYLYTGQFCTGFSQGAVALVATVYIAESLVPDNLHFRSSLVSWNVLSVTTGLAAVYFLGYIFRYDSVALIGASLAFISSILILVFVPESPAWLDQKGRHKEAEQARYKLGCTNTGPGSTTGYQPIDDSVKIQESLSSYLLKVRRKDVYKPLFVTMAYFFFMQFSGTQVYSAYMVDIIAVKSININPYLTTLICGVIMEAGQIAYAVVVPQIGLKKAAILSSVLGSLTTLVLGVCIQIQGESSVTWYSHVADYIHILVVWVNVFASALGIATIPFAIVGEIFPADAKGLALIPIISVSVFYFINLMIYPFAIELSSYAIYYVYAIIGFLAVPFIHFSIPETVGKTLEQISLGFSS